MLRILAFLAIILAIGSGLAFIAAQSGEVVLLVAQRRIVLPLFTAICALLIMVGIIWFCWWLVKMLIQAPRRWRNRLEYKREQRGYHAISQGLIATMSGDIRAAQRFTRQSHALLNHQQEPLLPLLAAETKRLELDYQGAVSIFQSMCDEPLTRLIGLKGLYREAMRSGDDEAASQYATQAVALDATLEWAIRASLTHCALAQSWEQALQLLDAHDQAVRKSRRKIKIKDIEQWRPVLLCAHAQASLKNQPDLARDLALRAHKLAPDFVPAATIAARSLFALAEHKKGEKLIENFWRKNPHPDLGQIYLEAESETSDAEKLRRAMLLESLKPDDPASKMLVAQAAFAAGELEQARLNGEKLLTHSPTEGVFLLLADVHAALDGDEQQIRAFLTKAVHAQADFAWVADGQIMAQWVPISPLSHRIGACAWCQPPKHLPPLLALPKAAEQITVYPADALPPEQIQTDEPAETKTAPTETIAAQVAPDFLKPPPSRKKQPSSRQKNAPSPPPTRPPPTRIVVDDPGIIEDEDKP